MVFPSIVDIHRALTAHATHRIENVTCAGLRRAPVYPTPDTDLLLPLRRRVVPTLPWPVKGLEQLSYGIIIDDKMNGDGELWQIQSYYHKRRYSRSQAHSTLRFAPFGIR